MPTQSNTIAKQRIEFIDLLKAFSIFCVLWFHSIGDLTTGYSGLAAPVFRFILTFNMPLFFMISGFFFSSSVGLSFKEVLRKRFTVLIIPHITWSILVILMNFGISVIGWRMPFADKPFTVLSCLQAIFNPHIVYDLYFFKSLFLTDIIVFLSCKIFKKRYIAFIASMLFVLLFDFFGEVDRTQRFMMPIFWAGILLKTYYPFFCKHVNKLLIGSGVLLLAGYYFYDYTWMIYLMDYPALINFQQSLAEGKLVFDFTNIGISVFRSVTGIAGSVFFFALFQRFWKKNAVTSYLSRYGLVTVGIYGIQSIILQRIMHNVLDFTAIANAHVWVYQFIITPLSAVFVLFVSILIIRLIQRNKRLTFALFGSSVPAADRPAPQKN